MQYSKVLKKIKATKIAQIEGISYHKVRNLILEGEFGPYWKEPLRITEENYLLWQEKNRVKK